MAFGHQGLSFWSPRSIPSVTKIFPLLTKLFPSVLPFGHICGKEDDCGQTVHQYLTATQEITSFRWKTQKSGDMSKFTLRGSRLIAKFAIKNSGPHVNILIRSNNIQKLLNLKTINFDFKYYENPLENQNNTQTRTLLQWKSEARGQQISLSTLSQYAFCTW